MVENVATVLRNIGREFQHWKPEAQRKFIRHLFGASGSLKRVPDIGIFVRSSVDKNGMTTYTWVANGWFGDMEGATWFGDEGLEMEGEASHWRLTQGGLNELASIVAEHGVKSMRCRVQTSQRTDTPARS